MATGWLEKRYKSSWTMVIDEGKDPLTGERIKWAKSVKTTDKEVAQGRLDIILGKLAEKTFVKTPDTTVKEYFEQWFTTPEAMSLAPKTQVSYKGCLDDRIAPWIGHIKLDDLKRKHLKAFYKKIYVEGRIRGKRKGEPVKKRTVELHHQFIRRVLNHAVYEDEILRRNVADKIEIPDPPYEQEFDENEGLVKVFTAEEVIALEKHTLETPYYALVAIALRTGMRRGELLALTWDCINFDKATIFIKKSVSYTSTKGCFYKLTKNKKRRIIDIAQDAVDILRTVKEKQDKFKKESEEISKKENLSDEDRKKLYEDNNLVFCWDSGKTIHPDTPSSWFPEFCVSCGLPRLTFHCLRHTHASHLLAEGEEIAYVSKRLGHSDITTTYKTYFHFIPEEKREAVKRLEDKFK